MKLMKARHSLHCYCSTMLMRMDSLYTMVAVAVMMVHHIGMYSMVDMTRVHTHNHMAWMAQLVQAVQIEDEDDNDAVVMMVLQRRQYRVQVMMVMWRMMALDSALIDTLGQDPLVAVTMMIGQA